MMIKELILTFREDMAIQYGNNGEIFIQNEAVFINIEKPSPGTKAFIEKLDKDGATEDDLADIAIRCDGIENASVFYYYLEKFARLGMLCRTLNDGAIPFATLEPFSYNFKWTDDFNISDGPFILSRFALIRRERNRFILESPLTTCRILLHHAKCSEMIHHSNEKCSVDDICNKMTDVDKNVLRMFLAMLLNSEFISKCDPMGIHPEDENEVLCQWEFQDLLFHNYHRTGRNNYPHGASYPFADKIEPRPPYKKPMTDTGLELFTPDMERLQMEDYPFTLVIEERKSIRSYGDKPITVDQLGEFLYRSYRIKEVKNIAEDDMYDLTVRPCAGGGACYELEIYPVVNQCDGLSSGIYHYDPLNHKLHQLTERNDTVDILLKHAHASAAKNCTPEVLILITARFQRVSWKYRGMAYAAILKNVGALYQNMYLVATAMELAPCALGCGDSEMLCHAAGLDYLVESPVGEFMLGSKRI
jgi:SagB-type dehydrogenase family enzyme